jgi:hypothetical protein
MLRVKDWEIIADNLSKAGWSWAASQPWILAGEQWRWFAIPQATECGSTSGNQIDATMIFARADFVSSFDYHATFLGCVRMDLYD